MRRILLNYARAQHQKKRGQGAVHVTLGDAAGLSIRDPEELIALDEALEKLSQLDARKVRVVEMKFFGGLSAEEIATALGISPVTVAKDWNFARSWLRHQLQR